MASFNYFPATYQQYYPQQPQQYTPSVTAPAQYSAQPQQSGTNGLIWVQGEAGAKSYLVAPNTTVLLMDSEAERFYIKSSDASGMPMPLRVFEYHETVTEQPKADLGGVEYVTTTEFAELKKEVEGLIGKSSKARKEIEVNE